MGLGLMVFSVFLFSWLPNPSFKTYGLLPLPLARWADENYNIRTAIPFFMMAYLARVLKISVNKIFIMGSLLVLLAELIQIALPLRHFDIFDIAYGISGLGMGTLIYAVQIWVLHKFK